NNFAGLSGETLRIWTSDYSSVIFSQFVTPTLVSYNNANQFSTATLNATISGLFLSPGTYGISFQAYNLGRPLFAGGDGSVLTVENPGCVPSCGFVNFLEPQEETSEPASTGYQLLSDTVIVTPLPSALPL